MTFHTQKNINTPIQQTWIEKFISQPHQLFFASTIFFAIVTMSLTILLLSGLFQGNFTTIHSFGLTYGVFTNAFLGFLITVIPKYTNSIIIDKKYYVLPWVILQIGIIATLIDYEMIGKLVVVFTIFYFNYIFYKTIRKGKATAKKETIYLNILLFIGSLLLLSELILDQYLSIIIFFGYLVSLVFIVAQRMVPVFYSNHTQTSPWKKPKYLTEISSILFLLVGMALQFESILFFKMSSFLSMIYFGYIIINLNIYKKTPPILSILVVAFIWLEIGFIALFIESIFEIQSLKLSLHIFALGFVTNLLIGFGSRVIMGHAIPAQKIFADKVTIFLFILTQIIVISRILASVIFIKDINIFMHILYLSSIFWIVLFIIWTLRYGKTILRLS
jgi:uncharacterized protein involved in response to NO